MQFKHQPHRIWQLSGKQDTVLLNDNNLHNFCLEFFCYCYVIFVHVKVTLRRLVYLAIKEMSKIADDVIIVTSR